MVGQMRVPEKSKRISIPVYRPPGAGEGLSGQIFGLLHAYLSKTGIVAGRGLMRGSANTVK